MEGGRSRSGRWYVTVLQAAVLLTLVSACYQGSSLAPHYHHDYTVQSGDTLYAIGQRFGVSVEELRSVNNIQDPRSLQVGQKLRIPARLREQGRLLRAAKSIENGGVGGGTHLPIKSAPPFMMRTVKLGAAQKHVGRLVFPVPPESACLNSRFNWRWSSFHEGVDLGAPYGTPVYAAHAGQVIFSGWRGGYGNLVIVRGDDLMTVYGHNSALCVKRGEYVARGKVIAYVGDSGNASGAHLHFETRIFDPTAKGWVAVDPAVFYR